MSALIAVSSYSLRQLLGPIRVAMRGPDGQPSAFVWDQPQVMTLLELPRAVREHLNLNAIEICQFHIPERSPNYIAALKRALREAEVQLVNMPIDVGNISDANPEYRAEDLAEIEAWMQVAAELGAGMVRVNASAPIAATPPAPLAVTIESYARLARTAKTLGLDLLIENHGGITADPEVIVALVEAVGADQLKVLVDIGNFEPLLSMQMAEMQGLPIPDADVTPLYASVARIAPYAHLVHAKTHGFDSAGNPLRLDVLRALRVIQDAGYTGPFSLEYEGNHGDPWENTRRTLALVQQVFG
jgi:sugar phosphate isomerase/epimerase